MSCTKIPHKRQNKGSEDLEDNEMLSVLLNSNEWNDQGSRTRRLRVSSSQEEYCPGPQICLSDSFCIVLVDLDDRQNKAQAGFNILVMQTWHLPGDKNVRTPLCNSGFHNCQFSRDTSGINKNQQFRHSTTMLTCR